MVQTKICHKWRDDAPLVVFDFDHTLYDGDSGSHLFAWLIKRNPLRLLVAILATPLLVKQARYVMREQSASAMPPMLERTVKGALLTNLLFVLGIVLSQILS